ncbi:hypothetical protein GCM10010435_41030 [Winogradskya consettensis]|uniref:ESAT-6-like protein n=1 Tax=Winogradskya consettensis TaxID=113560 RepID=A0A919SDS8_9ACTN|nr:WXG100 family type VII secretion target [Actinoplanes consettensis]GIM69809.1 hypothetical protein Aco04nite_17160 [Actinoplanes consettensis]
MSYTFNFAVAQQTLHEMLTINTNITGELSELETYCNAQLAEWTGDAQVEYQAAKTEWNSAAQQMAQAFTNAQTALTNITEGYINAESIARGVWQK